MLDAWDEILEECESEYDSVYNKRLAEARKRGYDEKRLKYMLRRVPKQLSRYMWMCCEN